MKDFLEKEIEFINHLHDEKIKTQEERYKFSSDKIKFALSLFGLGAIKINNIIDLSWIYLLVPFVAISFDFLIYGTDGSIKRIGSFLRRSSFTAIEKEWEDDAAEKRDKFAPRGQLIISLLVCLISIFLLFFYVPDIFPLIAKIGYSVITVSLVIGFFIRYQRKLDKLDKANKPKKAK